MRLLHLAEYTNHYDASFNRALHAYLVRAAQRGFQPEAGFPAAVAGAHWVEGLKWAGVKVHLFESSGRRDRAAELRDLIPEGGPLLLHTHFTTFDVAALLATRARPETILFWHAHTVLKQGPTASLRNALKLVPSRGRVDRIICPASNIRDDLIRRGARSDRTTILPSPVDPDVFKPMLAPVRAECRTALGIEPGQIAILHFGRDWMLKGGDVFATALADLRSRGFDVIGLSLQGGDPAHQAAERLGLVDILRPLDWVASLTDLYAATDCMLATSRGEGMPFTVVEALACGIPVVATSLPGHRYLGDHIAACTIADGPGSIADATAALITRDSGTAEREAALARDWIIEHLNPTTVADQLVDEYQAVAEVRGIPIG